MDSPVIIILIPFYRQGSYIVYQKCFASVLLYMNSNGDVLSFRATEIKFQGSSDELQRLEPFARELYNTAMLRNDLMGGNTSTAVVYWDVLTVRTGALSGEDCWALLSKEVAKEVGRWAETLNKP